MPLSSVYDDRYQGTYRDQLSGYEVARWKALEHFIAEAPGIGPEPKALDYGAGSGLYVGLWERTFPRGELNFCDISRVGLGKLAAKHPAYAERCFLVENNRVACPDNTFDVVTSIEVMEHVEDLDAYLADIRRVLKPGGSFIWTTPCGNWLSIEHVYSAAKGQIEPTSEGYRRWAWEDPTHLRRMRTDELARVMARHGFSAPRLRFRSHFFSFVCSRMPTKRGMKLREKLMTLDYSLFRRLPNGASMIGQVTKL